MREVPPSGLEVIEAEPLPASMHVGGPYRVVSAVKARPRLTIRWRRGAWPFAMFRRGSIRVDSEAFTATTGPAPVHAAFRIPIADVIDLHVIEPIGRSPLGETWLIAARDRGGRTHELGRVDTADQARWLVRRLGALLGERTA